MNLNYESFFPAPQPEEPSPQTQLIQRFLQLSAQLDALQGQVSRVAAELEAERGQINALLQQLSREVAQPDPLPERLAELTEQISADHDQLVYLGRKLTEVATKDQLVRLATVVATQQHIMDLAENVTALGRAQQRTNELVQVRGDQINAILTLVQSFLQRRSQLEASHMVVDAARLDALRQEGRGEFVARFLPALDGLEQTLEEGRVLLARYRQELSDPGSQPVSGSQPPPAGAPPPGSLVHRLRSRLAGDSDADAAHPPPAPMDTAAIASALSGWLRTLALVRDRFLGLMAQEGIQPIPTLRQSFDPQLHVAVHSEVRGDVPPDTIVREVRRGYRQGTRVLRFAEVVVARSAEPPRGAR
jgi:molecular chaperone GrpE (heat shock protein)